MSKLVHRVRSNVLVIFYFYLVVQYSASLLRLLQAPKGGKYRLRLCGISPPQREAGEKEKRKHARDDGKGNKESLFPFPSFPALSIFRLFLFSLGYPARASTAKRVMWWLFWNGCETKNSLQSVHLSELFSVCTFMSFYFHERFRSSC